MAGIGLLWPQDAPQDGLFQVRHSVLTVTGLLQSVCCVPAIPLWRTARTTGGRYIAHPDRRLSVRYEVKNKIAKKAHCLSAIITKAAHGRLRSSLTHSQPIIDQDQKSLWKRQHRQLLRRPSTYRDSRWSTTRAIGWNSSGCKIHRSGHPE